MAFLYPRDAVQITMQELATLSAADGKDVMTAPFNFKIIYVRMTLGDNGSVSDSTDVVIEAGGTDLWTVSATVGQLAHDSAANYLEWDIDDLDVTEVAAGTTLKLNVDVVPGTPGSNLVVTMYVGPTDN